MVKLLRKHVIKNLKKSYPTECNILLSEDIKITVNTTNRNCRPRGKTRKVTGSSE